MNEKPIIVLRDLTESPHVSSRPHVDRLTVTSKDGLLRHPPQEDRDPDYFWTG